MARAAAGSVHGICQSVFTPTPSKATTARYAHTADSAASALSAALPVTVDSFRFARASSGITVAAKRSMTIPAILGLG